MRLRVLAILIFTMIVIVACQGPPPTQIVLVITATPNLEATSIPVSPNVESATQQIEPVEQVVTSNASPTAQATAEVTRVRIRQTQTAEARRATPTPSNLPTPTYSEIQIAEQLFEHGRMYWLQPTKQIWVLVVTGEGRGDWTVYQDTFADGEQEYDSSIVPPEGFLQPVRGFGKLWRENPTVREELGWAVGDEYGYVSPYEYHPGGEVDAQGEFVPAPGYHILYSLHEEKFQFNEIDSTWQLGH